MLWYLIELSLLHYFSVVCVLVQMCLNSSVTFVKQICHRDLKLENTLLDGSPAPRLKICDFGYSKVYHLAYLGFAQC